MSDLFVCKGVADHIRSDNGKLRDELLQREAFDTLLEANGALRAVAAGGQNLENSVIHGGMSESCKRA